MILLAPWSALKTCGHSKRWLQNIARLMRELNGVEMIYPGHGDPGDVALLAWERGYLEKYRNIVASPFGWLHSRRQSAN